MNVQSLLVSGVSRSAVLLSSLGFAIAGVISMQAPPSVSEWANMPVATPEFELPSRCGSSPAVEGTVREFVDGEGNVFSPAVPIDDIVPLVSYRLLDRDIEGTFRASLVNESATVRLEDFEFSEGMFPGVQEGCRSRAFAIDFASETEPNIGVVVDLVEDSARPMRWRLVQAVDIVGAATETWSSEQFWVVPASAEGTFRTRAVRIPDPFYDRLER